MCKKRCARLLGVFAFFVMTNIFLLSNVFAIPSPWVSNLKIISTASTAGATVIGKAGAGAKAVSDHFTGVAAQIGNTPFCWKGSYGRGAGYVPWTCNGGKEMSGGLCYNKCDRVDKTGSPEGEEYSDHGNPVELRYKSDGAAVCWRDCPPGSSSQLANSLCNFGGAGRCYWYLNGLKPLCMNRSYWRGVGELPGCRDDQDLNGRLCYPKCNSGYKGVGPVCWGQCPTGYTDCGAACGTSAGQCATDIANMVVAPLMVIANITGMVLTAGSSSAGTAAAKAAVSGAKVAAKAGLIATIKTSAKALAKKLSDKLIGTITKNVVGQFAVSAVKKYGVAFTENAAQRLAKSWGQSVVKTVAISTVTAGLKDQLKETFSDPLFWASTLDPTGVVDVVLAFKKPICITSDLPDDIDASTLPSKEESEWYESAYDLETQQDAKNSLAAEPSLNVPSATLPEGALPTANQAGGTWKSIFVGSNFCLDVDRGGYDGKVNGAKVQAWGCNGSPNQQWMRVGDTIVSKNGMCLDVYGSQYDSFLEGATVQLWQCSGLKYQKMIIESWGKIRSSNTKCFEAAFRNGAPLQAKNCNGTAEQEIVIK